MASSRAMQSLSPVEVAHIKPVLEDSIDQLAIIGHLMPHGPHGRSQTGAPKTALHSQSTPAQAAGIESIVEGQDSLEEQFRRVMELRDTSMTELPPNRETFIAELRSLATSLQGVTRLPSSSADKGSEQSTRENLAKLHAHRDEMRSLFLSLLSELKQDGGFRCLQSKLQAAIAEREDEEFLIENEASSREYLEALQTDEASLQLKGDLALAEVDGKIITFKDQIQEKIARQFADKNYVEESIPETVTAAADKQKHEEKRIRDELKVVQGEIEKMRDDHGAVMNLLKTLYEELSSKLVHWSGKYDEDTMDIQERLDALQAQKEADLQKLQQMTETYKEYEKVVEEDRAEKEKIAKQHEKEVLEQFSATKIQAWWRGHLYRHQLGPYSKKKKKKGKGSGKKKKKGKGTGKKKKK